MALFRTGQGHVQCDNKSDVDGVEADLTQYKIGEGCFCFEDKSLWLINNDGFWEFILQLM